jgi:hypothetical protein
MATVIRAPVLEIRCRQSRVLYSLTMVDIHGAEVDKGEESPSLFSFFSQMRTKDQKVSRGTLGFNYDILNDNIDIGNLKSLEGQSFIKTE